MSNPAQLERALSEALDRFTDSFKALLGELHHSGQAASGPGPGTAAVCAGFDRIANAANQTDIMQALLDASEAFSGRCALLVVKGDKLACWRTRGIDDASVAALRGLDLAADGPSGWKQAVDGTGP